MLRPSDLFLSAVLTLAVGAPASADPITVSFTGVVVAFGEDGPLSDGSIALGTPYSGTFSYDPALLSDSDPLPGFGLYAIDPASFSLALSIGSYSISFDPDASFGEFGVDDDQPIILEDQHGLLLEDVGGFEALGSLDGTLLSLAMTDSTGAAVASDALAGIPYVDAAWDLRNLQLEAAVLTGPSTVAWLSIEGTLSFVPEPASALLFAPLALLAIRGRR